MKSHLWKLIGLSLCINISAVATIPDVWNIRSAPSSNHLNAVTYGNGLFVAVGSQGTILTSMNGRDWTARSVGTVAPSIWSATYGNGRYIAGGELGALIRSSTDGVDWPWTNGVLTIGIENIHGIAYGYARGAGLFVAVGRGDQINTSYILTSSNGLDWISRTAPTTNTLFGVSPCFGIEGGWAEDLFVAVGDRGTILTSTDGIDWVLRNSGTTVPLRAVLFHKGMIALGDNGTVLYSANGTTWYGAAPASFNIRGAAASHEVLVAVGNYFSEGRLQASVDGMTWPGLSMALPQPLNSVTFGAGSFVAVGDNGLIIQSGATNEWTKTTSGLWQEVDFWSLHTLPDPNQELVSINNPGFKAVAIESTTANYYARSLGVQSLIVDAPEGSFNQLLLNYPGLSVPLSVAGDLIVGPRGSIAGYYSALRGSNFYLNASAAFSAGATLAFNKIELESNASVELNLTNSSLAADLLTLGPAASVAQTGGSNQLGSVQMYGGSSYTLNGGILNASQLELQSLGWPGQAQFNLISGAINVNEAVDAGSVTFNATVGRGDFLMQGGFFSCPDLNLLNGSFTQSGGTNNTPGIDLPSSGFGYADYFLSGGLLSSSNITIGYYASPFTSGGTGNFSQLGGVHTNHFLTLYGYLRTANVHPTGRYFLNGGLFVSDATTLYGGVLIQTGGTNLSRELLMTQAGTYYLDGGLLQASNSTLTTLGCVQAHFIQSGGIHQVENQLILRDWVSYTLSTGLLAAPNIEVGPGAFLNLAGGAISNTGLFTISGGSVNIAGSERRLGQLQLLNVSMSTCAQSFPGPWSLSLDWWPPANRAPLIVHFQDSHTVPWSGPLSIYGWRPPTNNFSGDHIYVGTNSGGLTSAQLSLLTFKYPGGQDSSPARILPDGELVPASYAPPLFWSSASGSLVFSWAGTWQLVSSTNVTGPYLPVPNALSPFTNIFNEPRRFFALDLPGQ